MTPNKFSTGWKIWLNTSLTGNRSIFLLLTCHDWWTRLNFNFCRRWTICPCVELYFSKFKIASPSFALHKNKPVMVFTPRRSNLPYKGLNGCALWCLHHAGYLVPIVEQIKLCASIVHFLLKSMKFGVMIVFKALKKIGYGAIAKKSVKCEK